MEGPNLKIMLLVVIVTVPIVIAYQVWVYRFREKITTKNAVGYQ